MLSDYPVDFTAPEVKELLRILETIYRDTDIVRLVQDAGLQPADVDLNDRPALVWRSVFDLAAGFGAVNELLDEVSQFRPALKIRLDELRTQQTPMLAKETPVAEPAATDYDSPAWKNFSTDGQSEAIIVAGQPTFVDVSFLALGLNRARSVCRLTLRFPEEGSGTAFRIGPRRLLTNHHVLFDHEVNDRKVTAVQAWFNYESDESGKLRQLVQLDCDVNSIKGEKADDWAVIDTVAPIPPDFPVLPLVGAKVPEVDDRVYIIQHPGGQPKKIAFQHNLVRLVDPAKIQYWTDTDLGSSGSPVFDEDWAVTALHHFSVPAPNGDRVAVRNQGRRIDRIVERMTQLGVYP